MLHHRQAQQLSRAPVSYTHLDVYKRQTKAGAKATVTVTEVSTPAETTEIATTEATTAPATQATACLLYTSAALRYRQ